MLFLVRITSGKNNQNNRMAFSMVLAIAMWTKKRYESYQSYQKAVFLINCFKLEGGGGELWGGWYLFKYFCVIAGGQGNFVHPIGEGRGTT
jgi:hypothetical protein